MNLAVALVAVALSMAAQDFLGTVCVVAEARGRAHLAGLMDAAGDVARVICVVFGAGEITVHGWNARAVLILAVMAATSYATTRATTSWSRKLTTKEPS